MPLLEIRTCLHLSDDWFIDIKVTLERNPKIDRPRRATQKANMKCRGTDSYKFESTQSLLAGLEDATALTVLSCC